jgi:hypothetical protein
MTALENSGGCQIFAPWFTVAPNFVPIKAITPSFTMGDVGEKYVYITQA